MIVVKALNFVLTNGEQYVQGKVYCFQPINKTKPKVITLIQSLPKSNLKVVRPTVKP
ncbi:hypothetical protein D3C75_822360 [compost metagenome]